MRLVIHIDGVLNNRIEDTCKILGVEVPASLNTGRAPMVLIQSMGDADIYQQVTWVRGVEELLRLKDVSVHFSNSAHSYEVLQAQRTALSAYCRGVNWSNVRIQLGPFSKPEADVDFALADRLSILNMYPDFTVKLLMDRPYNQEEKSGVVRVTSLHTAAKYIRRYRR